MRRSIEENKTTTTKKNIIHKIKKCKYLNKAYAHNLEF